jgi:transmembrane sensor
MTKETRQQAQFLLARYIGKQASPQEEALLFDLMNKEENSQDWEEMLEELIMLEEENNQYNRERWQPIVEKIVKHKPATKKIFRIPRWSVAASILLVLGIAGWLLFRKSGHSQPVVVQQPEQIAPGKEGAVLTLSDGSKMVLDSLGNGIVATQSGTTIELKNGRLTYQASGRTGAEILYNTMSTPRGRQFQLSLPDGSKVWLNAESSIRYPVDFTGNQRKVEITGEAYFEVVKNTAKPFIVAINPQTTVEVLGTHFNINAYNNEPAIATTLLEGAVKFSHEKQQSLLKPGQQARAATTGKISIVNDADIDKVMAWKNGAFNFEGASLEQLMRQLERWYDITVVYENGIPQKEFTGEIGRNVKLADVVEALHSLGVNLRLEGRTLIVSP